MKKFLGGMKKSKLRFVCGAINFAVATLLLLSKLTRVAAVEFEADRTSYAEPGEPSRARSQHWSNNGTNPNFSGGPRSASSMALTVSGSVFCTSCMSVNTPLFGILAELLCPHPPPGTIGRVSSAVTGKDGSFHLTINASYAHIINRCVVIISKSSDSNCDMPPPTGTSIPVWGPDFGDDLSDPHFSPVSFSFSPASCPLYSATARKPRAVSQHAQDRSDMEQMDTQKDYKHTSRTRGPVSASNSHGSGAKAAAVSTHDHVLHKHHHHRQTESRSQSHRNKDQKAKGAAVALQLSPVPKRPPSETGKHSLAKSLLMVLPSHPHSPLVSTNSHGHSPGGGPRPTTSTSGRRRNRRGPPRSDTTKPELGGV